MPTWKRALQQAHSELLALALMSAACGTQSATPEASAGNGQTASESPATQSTGASQATANTQEQGAAGGTTATATTMTPAMRSGMTSGTAGSSSSSVTGTSGTPASAMQPQADGSAQQPADAGSAGAGPAAPGNDAAATAGDAGTAEAPDAQQPAVGEDYGTGDGSDVITIGDSWMSIATNGGGIEAGLDRAGTHYRHYAVAGTTLLTGQIPAQYDQAKAVNPNIKTIIMTGGGNDVMFSGGCSTKESCAQFSQMIADGLDQLWQRASKDGVTGAVYIQYSRNAGTAPSDTRPKMPAAPSICTKGTFRCVFVNTTDLISRTDTVDGIHPTFDGCDRIAKRVLDEMEKNGVRR